MKTTAEIRKTWLAMVANANARIEPNPFTVGLPDLLDDFTLLEHECSKLRAKLKECDKDLFHAERGVKELSGEIDLLRKAWQTMLEKHACLAPQTEEGLCTCGLSERMVAARKLLDG